MHRLYFNFKLDCLSISVGIFFVLSIWHLTFHYYSTERRFLFVFICGFVKCKCATWIFNTIFQRVTKTCLLKMNDGKKSAFKYVLRGNSCWFFFDTDARCDRHFFLCFNSVILLKWPLVLIHFSISHHKQKGHRHEEIVVETHTRLMKPNKRSHFVCHSYWYF